MISNRRGTARRRTALLALAFFLAHLTGLGGSPAQAGPRNAAWDGTAAAAFAGGSGTDADPYRIATAEELALLADLVNAASVDAGGKLYSASAYVLSADIDLDGVHNWTPIGVSLDKMPFLGAFDGAGHTISGMRIVSDDYIYDFAALFGTTSDDAAIRNLSLRGYAVSVDYAGTLYAGGLVGINRGAVLRSDASGALRVYAGLDSHAGGLVGNNGNKGSIRHSVASVTINAGSVWSSYIGGLVGGNNGHIAGSATLGTVCAEGHFTSAGGLAGYNDGHIAGSAASVAVYGMAVNDADAGGLVGYNSSGTIAHCVASGATRVEGGFPDAGGLVGYDHVIDRGAIANSTAWGAAYAESATTSANAGGLVGYGYGRIANSAASGAANAVSTVSNASAGGLAGVVGASTENSYAYGTAEADGSASYAGGFAGSIGVGSNVASSDWRQDAGINEGLGGDAEGILTNTQAAPLSTDQFRAASIDHFLAQGWDFGDGSAGSYSGGDWCYTALDGNARPHPRAFFGADTATLSADMVAFYPGSVNIAAGDRVELRLLAAGWERSVDAVAFDSVADSATINGVWVEWGGAASPDVVIVSADVWLTDASRDVAVTFAVNGAAQRASFGLRVDGQTYAPTITTSSLPDGTVGSAYSQTVAFTGTRPVTLRVTSGNLPSGLSLSEGGAISGTPSAEGTFTFAVTASNGAGSDEKTFTLTIEGADDTTTGGVGSGGGCSAGFGMTLLALALIPLLRRKWRSYMR